MWKRWRECFWSVFRVHIRTQLLGPPWDMSCKSSLGRLLCHNYHYLSQPLLLPYSLCQWVCKTLSPRPDIAIGHLASQIHSKLSNSMSHLIFFNLPIVHSNECSMGLSNSFKTLTPSFLSFFVSLLTPCWIQLVENPCFMDWYDKTKYLRFILPLEYAFRYIICSQMWSFLWYTCYVISVHPLTASWIDMIKQSIFDSFFLWNMHLDT